MDQIQYLFVKIQLNHVFRHFNQVKMLEVIYPYQLDCFYEFFKSFQQ
jgi:hypothetical protein